MAEHPLSSAAFACAVTQVAAWRGRVVVVKLGGSAMEDAASTDSCLKSVATLNQLGMPIVLVHGGGKPIDRAMAEAGLKPKKVAGRRYTDEKTLEIVVRVLHRIATELIEKLREWGLKSHAATDALRAEKLSLPDVQGRPIDLGRVGTITGVDVEYLQRLIAANSVPVIPSLAIGDDKCWLNVNADTAASAVAGALKAERTVFLTDTPGVLRDRANPKSLISHLTEREARELIARGIIDGGMVPKVEACFEALEAGAKSALILDGRVPYSLLDVFLHDTFTGTAISR